MREMQPLLYLIGVFGFDTCCGVRDWDLLYLEGRGAVLGAFSVPASLPVVHCSRRFPHDLVREVVVFSIYRWQEAQRGSLRQDQRPKEWPESYHIVSNRTLDLAL